MSEPPIKFWIGIALIANFIFCLLIYWCITISIEKMPNCIDIMGKTIDFEKKENDDYGYGPLYTINLTWEFQIINSTIVGGKYWKNIWPVYAEHIIQQFSPIGKQLKGSYFNDTVYPLGNCLYELGTEFYISIAIVSVIGCIAISLIIVTFERIKFDNV